MDIEAISSFDGSHVSAWDASIRRRPSVSSPGSSPFSAVRDSWSFSTEALARANTSQNLEAAAYEGEALGYGITLSPLAAGRTHGSQLDVYV